MHNQSSTRCKSRSCRALALFLALASLLGVPSSARLVAASAAPGPVALPESVGTGLQDSPRAYLPLLYYRYPPRPTTIFGVQIYEALNTPKAGLNYAKQAGVTWVRWPVSWWSIEPHNTTPDNFKWAALDSALGAAWEAEVKVILTLDGNPTWAGVEPSGPIDRAPLSEYAEFMNAVVERYDGDGLFDAPGSPIIEHFEFYNEPDRAFQWGGWGEYGADYGQMLCAVYPAMKKASPNAKVLMGGIAHDYFEDEYGSFVRRFLDDVLAEGGGDCMDYMVFHYYPAFEFRWAPYGPGVIGKTEYLRRKLGQYGVGDLPIMITEGGFFSNATPEWPSSERLQASYVVKFFAQAAAADIKAFTWWLWTDLPGYPDAYGLMTTDFRAKEAYYAFQIAARRIGLSKYQRSVPGGELGSSGVEAYLFLTPRPLYVLWATGDGVRLVALPGSAAQVRDLVDNTLGVIHDASDGLRDGMVHIPLDKTPIYVEIIE